MDFVRGTGVHTVSAPGNTVTSIGVVPMISPSA